MNKTSMTEGLKALAEDSASRSKIGRMREIFNDIEAAQKAGVSNKKIVDFLNTQGFEITIKVFETMLYRLRTEQAKSTKSNDDKQPSATSVSPSTVALSEAQRNQEDVSGENLEGKALVNNSNLLPKESEAQGVSVSAPSSSGENENVLNNGLTKAEQEKINLDDMAKELVKETPNIKTDQFKQLLKDRKNESSSN